MRRSRFVERQIVGELREYEPEPPSGAIRATVRIFREPPGSHERCGPTILGQAVRNTVQDGEGQLHVPAR